MNGQQIRRRRDELKMSQAALAEAIGMPGGQTYVSAVELGKLQPTVSMLERFAAALGLQLTVELTDPNARPAALSGLIEAAAR